MKNKHLVLLFFLALLVGLAIRRAPWREDVFFHKKLLPVDTAKIIRAEISFPGQGSLLLIRNETGWLAEQKGRSARVPSELSREMLAAIADLRSIHIVKTDRADTLGFVAGTVIGLAIYYTHAPYPHGTEYLEIGWETIENSQPATYVRFPRHGGIYLAENQLRAVFSKTIDDFRNAALIRFNTADVRSFTIYGQKTDSIIYQKNDATGNWQFSEAMPEIPDSSVLSWLQKVERLKNLPLLDLSVEDHVAKRFFAQIDMEMLGHNEPLSLSIYRLPASSDSSEIPPKKVQLGKVPARFALSFSEYPHNFFALSDTSILQQICHPF